MIKLRNYMFLVMIIFTMSTLFATQEAGYKTQDGTLEGALYKIVLPEKWNGKLLLKAHGGRPEKAPLSADFKVKGYVKTLLEKNWMVAETSYRRNGIIINDAVKDLNNLLNHIEKKHGKTKAVYLLGASMGGKIAVQMAEEKNNRLSGVVAVGAALFCKDWCQDKKSPTSLTFEPKVPLLFVSNVNEIKEPKIYTEKVKKSKLKPVVWTLERKGHCKINRKEVEKAVLAVEKWAENGKKPVDTTLNIEILRKNVATRHKNGRAYTKVFSIHPVYGSIVADFSRADFRKLGIEQNSYFYIGYKDKKFKAYFGSTYDDVPRGKWISFITAEDYLMIARNWASAVELLGCKKGEELFIETIKK